MEPSQSTEEDMKQAFAVFDEQAIGESDDDDKSDEDSDGEGEIGKKTRLLRRFMLKSIILPRQARDKHRENPKNDRVSADVKELKAFTDDERKLAGVTPLYGFQASSEEIDAMAMEADLDGEGKIDYDEFVAVIFSSWERKQQTDNLKKWLYRCVVNHHPSSPATQTDCRSWVHLLSCRVVVRPPLLQLIGPLAQTIRTQHSVRRRIFF
jgi:hypothetical protein